MPERVLSPLCPICSKAAHLREMKGEAMKSQFYTASDEIKSYVFVVKWSSKERPMAGLDPDSVAKGSSLGEKMALLIISSPIFLLPHRSNK